MTASAAHTVQVVAADITCAYASSLQPAKRSQDRQMFIGKSEVHVCAGGLCAEHVPNLIRNSCIRAAELVSHIVAKR